jgi:hypothetical protein
MPKYLTRSRTYWLVAGLLCACGGSPGNESATPVAMNGLKTQGQQMQGTELAAINFTGAELNQMEINNLQLNGTSFSGQLGAQTLSGQDFIGVQLTALDLAGNPAQVTITGISADPEDPSGQTLLYNLVSHDSGTGTTANACNPDASGAQLAIPVAGTWDTTGAHTDSTTAFTFGCTSGVIAKCVRWGYRPWESLGQESLAPYHQICTRLARADYCGDGITHTEEGTLVDVYDDLGFLTPTPNSGLIFDAAWTSKGAYCIAKERWLSLQNLTTFHCAGDFVNLSEVQSDPSMWASPVNSSDVCLVQNSSLSRDDVHIDNRSGINAAVQ